MSSMIFRFGLYGFLKNQRYFEAFLYLAFLAKGLDFFQIGLLVAFRAAAVNLFEVPSGAIADVCGRRRFMVLSLAAYIVSFAVLGVAEHIAVLGLGMVFYGLGDAFRSGTHKAMIFKWLSLQGRADERVKIYGYTRSWSKFGSVASVIIGASIVLVSDGYTAVFLLAIVPYAVGIVNLLGYPQELDAEPEADTSLRRVLAHMRATLMASMKRPRLRRLMLEAMGFDGVFASVKDYLQPVLEAAAVTSAAVYLGAADWSDTRRTALLVGPVYVVLFLLAAVASRQAHRVSDAAGGEQPASGMLWGVNAAVFGVLLAAAWFDAWLALSAAFIALHALHNVWRPILISRFDIHGEETQGASLLSLESQAQRVATVVIAPVLGLAVSRIGDHGPGGAFWPVGAIGLIAALGFFITARRDPR